MIMVGTLIINPDIEICQIVNGENLKLGNIIEKLNLNKKQRMKKVIAIFAIATLAACGNGTSTTSKVDSTKVSADTTVKAADSVVAK